MSRKSRPRRSFPQARQWKRVDPETSVRCAEGHDIVAPAWALFWPFRAAQARHILCGEHATAKGLGPAPAAFTLTRDDGDDVRARQAGE